MIRVFKGLMILVLCIGVSAQVNAQDSTKKADKPPVTQAKTPAAKPVHHIRRSIPPVIPNANGAKPVADTAQANALKAQMDPSQLNDKSLNGQYQYLLSKTYHYQQPLLAALWKNAMDTLGANRNSLKDAQAKLAAQKKLSDSLKNTAISTAQSLTESNQKVDTISLFGIEMSKSSYNLLMFGAVAVLALALVIVIVTTAKNKHEAKYRTELYDELDEEFKAFKAKANEKELKLARELQTERNKLDELLSKGDNK
jgi:hypothetical protein